MPAICLAPWTRVAALLCMASLGQLWPVSATADAQGPVKTIDTSSPRAVLLGFIAVMNEGYEMGFRNIQSYLASSRLYPSLEAKTIVLKSLDRMAAAERTIDFSGLPPAMARESSQRLTIQLKEILDRIDLPPIESVPDAKTMAAEEFKRWAIPGSEIRIGRIETGSRAGEYLFTAETVGQLPEIYAAVRDLPSKPGASVGAYEFWFYRPSGLALALSPVIPPRWLLDPPQWTRLTILDQPVWRWIGIVLVLGASLGILRTAHRLRCLWCEREGPAAQWAVLLLPMSLMIVAPAAAIFLAEVLRISGIVYQAATLSLWALFFLALTWTVWAAGTVVAENVIRVERIRAGSIDSQLIRLVLRLITVVMALAMLLVGADRIGLPAYSVAAGLGVGGLAVALAGQHTLANLLGSLILMLEKPFTTGDWIKVNGMEGTVEDVGFRSTRIRTFYDSLVTIPSSLIVNSTIDNMERRNDREIKNILKVCYDTPAEKVDGFVDGIRQLLEAHPDIRKDNLQVAFHEFGPYSLDILVKFMVRASNRRAELAEQQRILLDILRLAEAQGVRFAVPAQSSEN